MRVLVCGGRDYDDKARVWAALDDLCVREGLMDEHNILPDYRRLVIIHGGARGADALADSWAVHSGVPFIVEPADWGTHGRAAGPLRNQKMIDAHKPDLVIAFPGGRGTADMIRRAEAAGIEVRRIA